MGMIERLLSLVFGGGRNMLRDTAEVFRENAEASSARDTALKEAAMTQFAAEFEAAVQNQRGWFDRLMDAVNRVPRPALALGTLGLFVAAMVDPVWFAARMQGIALVPEPLWWLLGAIVSFYFGARHQAKGQEFQSRVVQTMAHVPRVLSNLRELDAYGEDMRGAGAGLARPEGILPETAAPPGRAQALGQGAGQGGARGAANPALIDWRGASPIRIDPRADER